MGSASDEPVVKDAIQTLEQLGIDYEVRVMSAHRTPERVAEYAQNARERGIQVLIAAAGGSAALGGALAAWSTLPVIGITAGVQRTEGNRCPSFHGADASRHPGCGHGRGFLGGTQRRLFRRSNPGASAP